jgi:hypothetical protein
MKKTWDRYGSPRYIPKSRRRMMQEQPERRHREKAFTSRSTILHDNIIP